MIKPMYLNMNEKPNKIIIVLRNLLLSLLVIVALSAMEKIKADEGPSTNASELERTRLNDVSNGSLLFKTDTVGNYFIAPSLETHVDMDINGMILRATVTQKFINQTDKWVEGIYVFPLPENSAVDHLRMRIGERLIKGFIQERKQAKKTYLKAKAAGKKAALIEQQRPNIFTNSVANIGPYETITVIIEYQQNLKYEKTDNTGQFSLRFPTTMTPRYIPGKPKTVVHEQINNIQLSGWSLNTDQVPDANKITPPIGSVTDANIVDNNIDSDMDKDMDNNSNRYSMNIRLAAGFEIEDINSPYHHITVRHQNNQEALISLRDTFNLSNRDFVLTWKPIASIDPKAAIFSQQLAHENYHFIMVMPPTSAMRGAQALAREVIYIIDTSGSMSGDSMEQAKKSLHFALLRLRTSDKFNIIQFDDSTHKMFVSAQLASTENIRHANQYINTLEADGGTEMLPALMAAMGSNNTLDDTYVRQIIFLTDGAVGNEAQLFSYIQQHLGNNRLFTVGIGSAPNSHFMTKAAAFGRGTFTYIGAVAEIQQKLDQLFSKLESPVLRNIELNWPGGMTVEAWPTKLPDLYLGEPMLVSVKSLSPLGSVTVSGTRANEQWQTELTLDSGKPSKGIAALWARNKISALTDKMIASNDKQKLQSEITNVAIQHHLVSKYTSLVAVDVTPTRPLESALFIGPIPLNLPAGSNQMRLIGQLANTATAAPRHLLWGVVLLLLSIISLKQKFILWRRSELL